MNSIGIVVPIPSRLLSPNARIFRMRKADAVRVARHGGKCRAIVACQSRGVVLPTGWDAAYMSVQWKHSGRQPDRDNSLASLKACIDGIADAGVIKNDSGFIFLPITFVKVPKGDECCEIIISQHVPSPCPVCGRIDHV